MSSLVQGYVVCGLASIGLTWLTRRYALHRGMVDAPGARRSHVVPTPRGGGLAIILVMLAACAFAMVMWPWHRVGIGLFGLGLLLVAGIGWWDDHRPLSAIARLMVHVVAAGALGMSLLAEGMSWWQVAAGGLLAIVLVNVWNFMDGINGLVTSQALIAAAGFACVLAGPWGWLAGAFVAALCGFLPFNFPRARIFLGDVGSGALGYALAALAALSLSLEPASPALVLLPLTLCCVDAGFTLIRRVLACEAWWTPHTTHAYQCAARHWGHTWVTFACAGFTTAATMLMLATWRHGSVLGWGVAIVFCMLASSLWRLQLARDFPTDEER